MLLWTGKDGLDRSDAGRDVGKGEDRDRELEWYTGALRIDRGHRLTACHGPLFGCSRRLESDPECRKEERDRLRCGH